MIVRHLSLGPLTALALLLAVPANAFEPAAKDLFGRVAEPSAVNPRTYGGYARGCLAGGRQLPADGPGWQAMRPGRNRAWGHPSLLAFIAELAAALRAEGQAGLLVGDMAQPRGGPMLTGHASHQLGLDVDLWLTPMPDRRLAPAERETVGATSMLRPGTRELDPARLGPWQRAAIRTAARFPAVERIFVHPAIKQALCAAPGGDRAWLAKVRPWYGHDAHFHVRLRCPPGDRECRPQPPASPGDGCGAELAWWLGPEPWQPPATPPPPPLVLTDLPAACEAVLRAPAP